MTIALYCRVSTTDKQELASQEKILQDWASRQSEPTKVYRDKASGKNFARVGFQTMMEDVKSQRIAKIVICALDRLGRNTIGLLQLVEDLKTRNVGLLSLREGFDPFTPMGQFVLTCMAAVASLERELIKSRVIAGIDAKRDPETGKCPWGGRKQGTRIKVTEEKEILIKNLHASQTPISQIARLTGLSRKTIYSVIA